MAKKPATKRSTGERRSTSRPAAGTDQAAKAAILVQLRRAKGQTEGIERMIEDDRHSPDIIVQIIAARASLQAVASAVLKNQLKACHDAAVKNGGRAADDMYQEVVDLVSRLSR